MENINTVVSENLCTSCGVCSGICPTEAINLEKDKYGIITPIIDEKICINCGKCIQVCPGMEFDYVKYMTSIHGELPSNCSIGPVIKTYSGRVKDELLYKETQSGGFVSQFLIYLIENKMIDGAVVTKWKENNPFTPSVFIAHTEEEILSSVGSKYNPIPVGSIVKDLMRSDGKYAFVGTPCQIQGMRKAENVYPELKEKISIYVGLHCLKVFNYYFHDQILHKIKVKKEDVKKFRYRDKSWRGWPCDMRIIEHNGSVYNLSGAFSRLQPRSYFSNWRCQLCFDKFNEFSDVSCGDCRIPKQYNAVKMGEVYYKQKGKSDIVIRTKRGEVLVEEFIKGGNIIVEESGISELIKSVAVAEKKLGVNYSKRFMKILGGKVPEYGVYFDVKDEKKKRLYKLMELHSCLCSGHYFLCHKLMKYKIFRKFLMYMPHGLLGLYEKMRERYSIQHVYRKEVDLVMNAKDRQKD